MTRKERRRPATLEYLADLLQWCNKVFVADDGEGQEHVECLETEVADLSLKSVCDKGKMEGDNTSVCV